MNTNTVKNPFVARIQPDCTVTFEGHRYHSPHFANLEGQLVECSGKFSGGKVIAVDLPNTGKTVRVAREGEELPPPSRLEGFCLDVGILSA